MNTPIGSLTLLADEVGLREVAWGEDRTVVSGRSGAREDPHHPALAAMKRQLSDYFSGKLKSIRVPLSNQTGTAFQQSVWRALAEIPFGETRSYQDIAIQIGRPKACRAVGSAANANPLPIVIPCHRMIPKSGGLGGFAGGKRIKQILLDLERDNRAQH